MPLDNFIFALQFMLRKKRFFKASETSFSAEELTIIQKKINHVLYLGSKNENSIEFIQKKTKLRQEEIKFILDNAGTFNRIIKGKIQEDKKKRSDVGDRFYLPAARVYK